MAGFITYGIVFLDPNLARYIIRASFSQERMTYLPEESRITYRSKDNRKEKAFDALDWLATMISQIPDQGEQMVRYYGFYSNVFRGLRQKVNREALITSTSHEKNSSRLTYPWGGLFSSNGNC